MALAKKQPQEALKIAEAAQIEFPNSQALAHSYVQSLFATQQFAKASRFLKTQTQSYPSQPSWWTLLAKAYKAQGKTTEQNAALAERFALENNWPAAIQQLREARRIGDADFYTLSMIDARLREFEQQYQRLQKSQKSG